MCPTDHLDESAVGDFNTSTFLHFRLLSAANTLLRKGNRAAGLT